MRTKAEAEAKLTQLPLTRPVVVTDRAGARRSFTFTLPAGNVCVVEIDANPSDAQLADLSRHLPLPEDKRAEALGVMRAPANGATGETRTK